MRQHGEMGGSVGSSPASCGSSLGSNLDISQKYKIGHLIKGVANTLLPSKTKIQKS
jgi:hypothetical protein